jgi:hypothetical protein
MIESPLLDELLHENAALAFQLAIQKFLAGRFGTLPLDIVTAIRSIQEKSRLEQLASWAGECADLAAFRTRLT